ncbi:daunorubicin resistance protein DrrA family ABC transporter ATP-binding protein [Paenibacillus sp. HGF5]|uniref:daunorubicin resistance protein DrrA family ABC transporter ATP-binding protein n=1 Tax=Paenibacillus sp. HGF5 TaxID=908341 RepID=UPI0002072B0B|nr:daunorubicin resistance protein DrrA family ABC transporter ATP-binding protein [Paenibacillus sp. HGF5]EGG31259.1 daunorubicin resistance ABC transporter, ATP-binding protein [Paenibacillus sp. HGF5]
MVSGELAIAAHHLTKHYGGLKEGPGLNGLTLGVPKGTIYGLLGPNGAGKTTAVKVFTTLLQPDSGSAAVAGFDVKTQGHRVREKIGLVGQYAAIDELLTGRRNLEMFGRLSRLTSRQARSRAEELLNQFELTDAGNMQVAKYSGGMRRRLDLAASLIVSPEVLFVDEPTTGLDPLARQEVWKSIRSLRDAGSTVLLTTQYLEEADQLADSISILKSGRIIAEGTSDELKSSFGGDRLEVVLYNSHDFNNAIPMLQQIAGPSIMIDETGNRLSVPVTDRTGSLVRAAAAFSDAGIEPKDIVLRRPTLDEVFIHFTGRPEVLQTQEVAE